MIGSKRVKKKILVNSFMCKLLGIISDQEYQNILNNIQSDEH
jgi:hypothetical protein